MSIIKPIAYIKTNFKDKFGIPRQSGRSPSAMGTIIFNKEFRNDDSLKGIEEFSHLWLIFDFSKSHRAEWSPTIRPPRLGGNKRVGVFATRSPFRPNSLGLSSVKFEGLKKDIANGTVILVSGVDLLDGTPIYDIKPYIPYTDCHTDAVGGFSDEFINYKLKVVFENNVDKILPDDIRSILIECLSDDPRPSYIKDKERIYKMTLSSFEILFKVEDEVLTVIEIIKK